MVDLPASAARPGPEGSVSRRSLMSVGVAGIAGLVVAGCSVDNPVSDDKTPEAPAELSPDVAVATSALAEIRLVHAAVTSTLRRFPALRPQLAPLEQMHRAHEKTLADAVPERVPTGASGAPAPYVVARQRDVALRNLTVREQRLHDTLAGLALRAQSGEFARLLASTGAAIRQRLAVLAA